MFVYLSVRTKRSSKPLDIFFCLIYSYDKISSLTAKEKFKKKCKTLEAVAKQFYI